MARIGFKKAKYNQIDTTTKKYKTLGTGSNVPLFEKVVDEKFAPEFNSAELYANDSLCESDYTFKRGKLSFTIADDNDKLIAELFGNTVGSSSGSGQVADEVTSNIGDTAPEFGYGHIVPKLVGGVKKYKVEFFPRIKFNSVSSDNKTRGESVEFSTTTLEATVYPLDETFNGMTAGTWEKHKTFTSLTDAETYLDGLLTPSA